MQHYFDISIAQKFDVDTAIFLNNIAFWLTKSVANRKHFYENTYWTYNSMPAYAEIFPYWTERQVRRIIDNCINNNLIIRGNFNHTNYDRTSWYTFTQEGFSLFPLLESQVKNSLEPAPGIICPNGQIKPSTICPNGQMEVTKPSDLYQIVNKDNKTTTTTTDRTNTACASAQPVKEVVVVKSANAEEGQKSPLSNTEQLFRKLYQDYIPETEKIKCEDDFVSAATHSLDQAEKDGFTKPQRIYAITKLVKQGTFANPIGWANHKNQFSKKTEEILKKHYEDEAEKEKRANETAEEKEAREAKSKNAVAGMLKMLK